jgi:hypothetical protein
LRAVLIVAIAGAAFAQTVTVEGRVVNGLTGEAVRKATVTFRGAGASHTVETNSSGAFRVDGLASGGYIISAQRTGFLPGEAKQIVLGRGERQRDVVVTMTPGSVISGRILDEDGDPLSKVFVRAMRRTYANGVRQLRPVRMATSDDRGQYRFFDLPAGRYFVEASWRNAGQGNSGLGYYPSAAGPEGASPVEAAPGGEIRGVDVRVRTASSYGVRVRITNAPDWAGPPPPGTSRAPLVVTLLRRSVDCPTSTSTNVLPISGRGNVYGATSVPPGSYVFFAQHTSGGVRLYARLGFDVTDRDVELSATMAPPKVVKGIVTGMGKPAEARVRLDSQDSCMFAPLVSTPGPDGAFVFEDVSPDRYFARVSEANGYYVKSIAVSDRQLASQLLDMTGRDEPVTIRMADDGGELAGLVLDTAERPAERASVALEPLASDWPDRKQFLFTDSSGNFRIHDVAPGEYRLLAWKGEEPDDSLAVRVRVEPNGDHRVTVRIR